jgi:hypothetical protein
MFSPFRVFSAVVLGVIAVLIYMTLHPKLAVWPAPDAGAAFGTLFNLRNDGISALSTVSSSYCVNRFHTPDSGQAPGASDLRLGAPGLSVELPDLPRHDTEALPIEPAINGTPGSQVDLVLIVKFQPGWWIDLIERRFRFVGTENQDKTWSWQQIPLGSPCG